MKRGLDTVGHDNHVQSHFSTDELRDLFTFREDTECETHELLQCECGGSGAIARQEEDQGEVRPCQLGKQEVVKSKRVEEMMGWRHFTSPIEDSVEDPLLSVASQFVSFLFRKTEHSGIVL